MSTMLASINIHNATRNATTLPYEPVPRVRSATAESSENVYLQSRIHPSTKRLQQWSQSHDSPVSELMGTSSLMTEMVGGRSGFKLMLSVSVRSASESIHRKEIGIRRASHRLIASHTPKNANPTIPWQHMLFALVGSLNDGFSISLPFGIREPRM